MRERERKRNYQRWKLCICVCRFSFPELANLSPLAICFYLQFLLPKLFPNPKIYRCKKKTGLQFTLLAFLPGLAANKPHRMLKMAPRSCSFFTVPTRIESQTSRGTQATNGSLPVQPLTNCYTFGRWQRAFMMKKMICQVILLLELPISSLQSKWIHCSFFQLRCFYEFVVCLLFQSKVYGVTMDLLECF